MTLADLFFLVSVLLVLVLLVRIAISVLRRRWDTAARAGRYLGVFIGCYAVVLTGFSLLQPRRFYAAGERRCFDDWCVAALTVSPAGSALCDANPSGRTWVAAIEVSSVAKRVRQRARDAHAELEDAHGTRYSPCAPEMARGDEPAKHLADELGPGESFRVYLPFRLPAGETPAGLVTHHGDFPGIVVIGADQSWLHPPALQRVSPEPSR